MSISEADTCCTPARVSSTMIQTANRNTATTIVRSPMPERIISTGTSAESGALTNRFTHMPSSLSAALTRPISTPSATPTTAASAMPMAKARSVVTVAAWNFAVWTSSTTAASTEENGGIRYITPVRPTISHRRHQTRIEAIMGTRYPNSVIALSRHILPQALPDLFHRIEIGAVPPDIVGRGGAIDVRLDDLGHLARPLRQQHHAIGDIDRLLDTMGDENEGLALHRAKMQQVLLEFAPGLLVHRRERLVHQQHVGIHGKRAS